MIATPLKFHGPGWRIEFEDGHDVILWAPRPADGLRPARNGWACGWQDAGGDNGNHVSHAATAVDAIDRALLDFPADVAPLVEVRRVLFHASKGLTPDAGSSTL